MPWGRLDDTLYDHHKVEQLPDRIRNACVGLWARAISLCNRHMTDGFVTDERLRKLDGKPNEIEALVRVGLFERRPGGIVVHDFLEFNDSREEILRKRAQRSEAGRRGGQSRWRKHDDPPSGSSNETSSDLRDGSPSESPSESPSNSSSKTASSSASPRPDPSHIAPPAPPGGRRRGRNGDERTYASGRLRSPSDYGAVVVTDDDLDLTLEEAAP